MPDELPLFPLAPWELPPDSTEPLVVPATLRWRGELFGRESDWLVRVTHSLGYHNVFVRDEHDLDESVWYIGCAPVRHDHVFLQEVLDWISGVRRGKPFERPYKLIYIADEDPWWYVWRIAVQEEGQNHVNVFSTLIDEWFPTFFIKWPFSFIQASSKQIHAEVLRAWNDDESDLRFARRWLRLSCSERNALLLCWKRGDEAAFLRMTTFVLFAFGLQCSSHSIRLGFNVQTRAWGCVESVAFRFNDKFTSPPVLQTWGRAISNFYDPQWNENLCHAHSDAQNYQQEDAHLFVWMSNTPTFHEQLEARHQLLAWLDERERQGELDGQTLARLRATLS